VTKAVIAIDVGGQSTERHRSADPGRPDRIDLVGAHAGLHFQNGLPLEGSYSHYHFARTKHYPEGLQIIIMPASNEAIGVSGRWGCLQRPARSRMPTRERPESSTQNSRQLPVDFTPIPPGNAPFTDFS